MESQPEQRFGHGKIEHIQKIETLGEGAYGVVYKGIHEKTKEIIALKKIKLETQSEGVPSTTIREISVLREINHENVVKLKDVIMCPSKMYLVFEYLEMDLKKKIDTLGAGNSFSSVIIKKYMKQLVSGVAACHSRRIIHRDLKPQNILLGSSDELKIADFGLARAFGIPIRPYTKEVVTLWYRAPELLLGTTEYSTPVDMWSVGCIFAEIISKRALFDGDSEQDQIRKIFRIMGTPNEDIWPDVKSLDGFNKVSWTQHKKQEFRNVIKYIENLDENGLDLLEKLLHYDPTQRISAIQALQHPYFSE